MEKTVFQALTAAEQEATIAFNIVAREQELFAYELNIDNYETALATSDISPNWRKQLTEMLAGETREREKSLTIYRILLTKIPAANIVAALAAAKLAMQPKV
jgi:hypothetical protein